jgi:beta-galactosidase
MDDLTKLRFLPEPCEGPCFYRAEMQVPALADTYLDTRGLHKGEAWVNQQPLGRFWSIGPQYTLFTPGPWLNKGRNDIVFFDLMGTGADALKSVVKPVYGATTAQRD